MTHRLGDRGCALLIVGWLVAGPSYAAPVTARSTVPRAVVGRIAGPVRGTDGSISGERFRELVRTAGSDPAALAQLRQVRFVDGRPVDVGLALAGADPRTVRRRLQALTIVVGPGSRTVTHSGTGAVARRDAARVLAGDKYQTRDVPRPLRGVLAWLGDRLDPLFGPVARFFIRLADSVLGGLTMVAVILAVTIVVARRLITGRSRAAIVRQEMQGLVAVGLDPASLDRQAAEAEARGDDRSAVRLHYQAGLIRLHRAGRIVLRADTTAGAVAAQMHSPDLDQLTSDFEEIVYGGRPVGPADAAAARAGWKAVLTAEATAGAHR